MKIAINALPYTDWQGIETFLAGLLRAWPKNDRDEIIVFANQKSAAFLEPLPAHLSVKIINFKKISRARIFLYQQFAFLRELKKRKIDVLFCPSLLSPWFYRRKVVVIHDLAPFIFKGESGRAGKIFWQICLKAAKYFSVGLVTVSEFSRQEISRYLKIEPEKIINISEACPDLAPTGEPADEIILKKFGLEEKKYFFYIGNVRPRKNLPNILLAWEKFNAVNGYRYQLVIAGKVDSSQAALKDWAIKNKIQKLLFIGFVPADEKTAIFKKALGLLFVSLYEGFGLPILEAQSLGVPVITGNTSALPETAGMAGALFADPLNIEEISEKINQLVHEEEKRQELIVRGKLNIQKYSWEISAAKLYENLRNK